MCVCKEKGPIHCEEHGPKSGFLERKHKEWIESGKAERAIRKWKNPAYVEKAMTQLDKKQKELKGG
jgi:hypothetical protein